MSVVEYCVQLTFMLLFCALFHTVLRSFPSGKRKSPYNPEKWVVVSVRNSSCSWHMVRMGALKRILISLGSAFIRP